MTHPTSAASASASSLSRPNDKDLKRQQQTAQDARLLAVHARRSADAAHTMRLWALIILGSIVSLALLEFNFAFVPMNTWHQRAMRTSCRGCNMQDVGSLRSSLQFNAVMLDVRERFEVEAAGRHPDSIVIPLSNIAREVARHHLLALARFVPSSVREALFPASETPLYLYASPATASSSLSWLITGFARSLVNVSRAVPRKHAADKPGWFLELLGVSAAEIERLLGRRTVFVVSAGSSGIRSHFGGWLLSQFEPTLGLVALPFPFDELVSDDLRAAGKMPPRKPQEFVVVDEDL